MQSKIKKSLFLTLGGLAVGIINGLLGAGGGMLAVPLLRGAGLNPKKAHANSVGIILPLSIFSSYLYLQSGRVNLQDALIYLPGGIIGALAGTWILSRISTPILRILFGIFIIFAGIRLLLR
ncbi:MAG TPA: sulfite exporter TauE/SafE family protein [Clostridiales bacterium]|nr:sulfite exporter TauE/SafE family protein [Clostridiales bacterium]